MYYENQSGGLCRLHSINAYFGEAKINETQFNAYMAEYDAEYKIKFNFESSCKNFDIVSSDQKNIVGYIMKKHNVYTKFYALNEIYGKSIKETILNFLEGDYFFIYNEGHIYGARRKREPSGDLWFYIDSLSGVRPMNIESLSHEKNIGFIIPVNIQQEFYHNLNIIKGILGDLNSDPMEKIKEHLIQKNKEKLILGCLELPLSICMDILETNLIKKNDSEFLPIKQQVIKYNEFLSQFTKGKYNDIDLIINFLPETLSNLTLLKS